MIRIFSRSPIRRSRRERARRLPGRKRSTLTPIASPRCATNCSRSARTTCATSGGACSSMLTGVDASAARRIRRTLGAHRRRSHAFRYRGARPLARSWDLPRRAAAPRRTSRFSRVRSAFRRSPAIEPARARGSERHGRHPRRQRKGTLRLHRLAPKKSRASASAQERSETQREEDLAHALEPAITLDGKRIEVLANIGGLKDATQVAGARRRRRRAAALGVSLHGTRERADAKTSSSQCYKAIAEAAGPGPSAHHSHARRRRRQAARLSADSAGRTIRSSASAECASASIVPRSCAPSCARFLRARRIRPGERDVSDDRDPAGASRRESDARRRSRRPRCRADPVRHHGGSPCHGRCMAAQFAAKRTSSPSGPTTSRSTRSRWIEDIRSSPDKSMA